MTSPTVASETSVKSDRTRQYLVFMPVLGNAMQQMVWALTHLGMS